MLFIDCPACQHGDHEHHTEVVQAVPEGMIGGAQCPCEGECAGRRSPQVEGVLDAMAWRQLPPGTPRDGDITRAVVWLVKVGNYTDPARVVAPLNAGLEYVGRLGKLAKLDEFLRKNVRSEHEGSDHEFWTDAVARCEVTEVKRGDEVYLDPRIALEGT